MVKRIFRNVVLTAILAVLLTAGMIVLAMYSVYENRMSDELRLEADYIVRALDMVEEDLAYFSGIRSDNRLTLIAPDGAVLYDSAADTASMENHAQRPEIIQALENGHGESTRISGTLSEMTLYYAKKTADGDVLRIASTRRSMLGAFVNVMPLVPAILLCVVILSLVIARRAASRIVAPLNKLNLENPLENDAYDELAPLLTRMEHQHAQIHQQMNALEKAHAELAAIMANMQEGLVLLDMQSNVLSINGSAVRVLGADSRKVLGQNWLSLNRDADLHELVQKAQNGESADLLWKHAEKTYQLFASPVMKQTSVRGTVLLILDVTDRFAAETSRREFTANVSHELKTPLTSISGYAEIIRDGIAQPQDIGLFAGRIHDEAQRMITLVNDILELSRLDEKQSLGQMEAVALKPLLECVLDDFTPIAQKKQLTLSLNGGEAQIKGYPLLLREMFFNLIDNAVKYTSEGGKVTIDIAEEADRIKCAVADNGIGISKEHQPHVFERFYRVDKSHSRATGGTGLGLAIVKHVAEIHHEQIQLDSTKGNGTVVTVWFDKE